MNQDAVEENKNQEKELGQKMLIEYHRVMRAGAKDSNYSDWKHRVSTLLTKKRSSIVKFSLLSEKVVLSVFP